MPAFGVCVAPPQKKIRKPLTMFQPVKKEKPASNSAAAAVEKNDQQVAAATGRPTTKFMPSKPGAKENVPGAKKVSSSITATIKPHAAVTFSAATMPAATSSQDKTFLVQQQQPSYASNRYGNTTRLTKTPSVDIHTLYDNLSDDEGNCELKF